MSRPRLSVEERFWAKVAKVEGDGCWDWKASRIGGYGQFAISPNDHVRAHRFAYELTRGPIPAGMFACHTCDRPSCVRPDHLFIGTAEDNARDCAAKGRRPRKVSIERASEIRARLAGGATQCELAAEFGVAQTTVSKIANGLTHRVSA